MVVTNISAIPELVEDGITGLLVPPRDNSGLAQAMLKMAREPEFAARTVAAVPRRSTAAASTGKACWADFPLSLMRFRVLTAKLCLRP